MTISLGLQAQNRGPSFLQEIAKSKIVSTEIIPATRLKFFLIKNGLIDKVMNKRLEYNNS
jgi:hypothetical protein